MQGSNEGNMAVHSCWRSARNAPHNVTSWQYCLLYHLYRHLTFETTKRQAVKASPRPKDSVLIGTDLSNTALEHLR